MALNTAHTHVDGLSHLPVAAEDQPERRMQSLHFLNLFQLECASTMCSKIEWETKRDPVMDQMFDATLKG